MNWHKLPPGRTQVTIMEQIDSPPAVAVDMEAEPIGGRYRKVVLDLQPCRINGKLIRRARHGDTVYVSEVK